MLVVLAPAGFERTQVIVETGGLGGQQPGVRNTRLDGERNAGRQPAAGRIDDHHLGRKPERRQILHDFASGGSLPGDDQRIVVGWHQHGGALVGETARDRRAVFAPAIIEHDLGAERRGSLAFGARRIGRHHDDRGHPKELRRRRYALRVIAG